MSFLTPDRFARSGPTSSRVRISLLFGLAVLTLTLAALVPLARRGDADATSCPDGSAAGTPGQCIPVRSSPSTAGTPTPEDTSASILVAMQACSAGYDADNATIDDLVANCTTPMADVRVWVFAEGRALAEGETDAGGTLELDLSASSIEIVQGPSVGNGHTVVYCTSHTTVDDQPVEDGPRKMTRVHGSAISYDLKAGETLGCTWFDVPAVERGSITIETYACPVGYNYLAAGANPVADCLTNTDESAFTLESATNPSLHPTRSYPGDIPATLSWLGLLPDRYTVTEKIPAETEAIFVDDCAGSAQPRFQSLAISELTTHPIELAAGGEVVCRWYTVAAEPGRGEVELVTFGCVTETFASPNDCERSEGTQSFTLTGVTGPNAGSTLTLTTDPTGRTVVDDLLRGTYELDGVDSKPCGEWINRIDGDGYLVIEAGETTHVAVYSCDAARRT